MRRFTPLTQHFADFGAQVFSFFEKHGQKLVVHFIVNPGLVRLGTSFGRLGYRKHDLLQYVFRFVGWLRSLNTGFARTS